MDFLAEIRRESDLFYATADRADATRTVPSCPEWAIADLVWHLAEVQWFWSSLIETKATDPDSVEGAKPPRPDSYSELLAFGRSQVDRLLSILDQNDDPTPVWTWAPANQTVGFIRRHQVQEAAVHRWDIENAAEPGRAAPIAVDAASDSIDEYLTYSLPWVVNEKKPLPGSVHLHCTDVEGEWFIAPNGQVERVHAKGAVAIRGAASDLLLALYTRLELSAVDVIGDDALAAQFIASMHND